MNALLIEEHPLLRLGLLKIFESIEVSVLSQLIFILWAG